MTLVDATPSDLMWLGQAWGRWACSARWSAPGHTPSPAALERLLWDGSLVQQVVLVGGTQPAGLLQLSDANLDSGHASLELFLDPAQHESWEPAVAGFVDQAFRDFPLRKLMLDLVPTEVTLPRCLADRAELVGRLPRHERRGEGHYVDRCLYEIRHDGWPATGSSTPTGTSTSAPADDGSPSLVEAARRTPAEAGNRSVERSSTEADRAATALPTSRRVVLEPLGFRHMEALHQLLHHPAMVGTSWLLDGRQLSVAELSDRLWAVSQLQYAVVRRDSGEVIGLVQGIDADPRSRTIGLGVALHPDLWMRGWPLEGVTLFVDLLFDVLGYRKVYAHMSASTLAKMGSAVRRGQPPEATFERHTPRPDRPGEHESWHIVALYRDQWDPQLVELIGGRRHRARPASASPPRR